MEIDNIFKSFVLLNFTYCLSVYGGTESDLNIIQHFLDRYHKRCFVSFPVSMTDLVHRQDCNILKAITSVDNHPLRSNLPPKPRKNIISVKNSNSPRLPQKDL